MLQSMGRKELDMTELNRTDGVRKCSNFIILHIAVQLSQHCLLKRLSFLHCIFLPPLSKIRCPWVCGLSLGFLSCSIGLYFCFCANTM